VGLIAKRSLQLKSQHISGNWGASLVIGFVLPLLPVHVHSLWARHLRGQPGWAASSRVLYFLSLDVKSGKYRRQESMLGGSSDLTLDNHIEQTNHQRLRS
jgi:hypothetical protein